MAIPASSPTVLSVPVTTEGRAKPNHQMDRASGQKLGCCRRPVLTLDLDFDYNLYACSLTGTSDDPARGQSPVI